MQPSEYSAQTAPAIAGYVRAAEEIEQARRVEQVSFLEALMIGFAPMLGFEIKPGRR